MPVTLSIESSAARPLVALLVILCICITRYVDYVCMFNKRKIATVVYKLVLVLVLEVLKMPSQ